MPRIWPGSSLNVEEKGDKLVVIASGGIFERLWLGCAVIFSVVALYKWFYHRDAFSQEGFQGSVGAAAVGLLGFVAMYERNLFTFDRGRRRVLIWSRKRLWSSKSGEVAFDDILLVSAKSPIGDDRTAPMRRIAVHTRTGEIPITVTYTAELYQEQLKLAGRISEFIGKPSGDRLMDTVRDSVRQGKLTEAVRLLRQERNMSLDDAKKLVDGIK